MLAPFWHVTGHTSPMACKLASIAPAPPCRGRGGEDERATELPQPLRLSCRMRDLRAPRASPGDQRDEGQVLLALEKGDVRKGTKKGGGRRVRMNTFVTGDTGGRWMRPR